MASADILRAARARIEDPEKWTNDAYARDNLGRRVSSYSSEAVCWCAWGSLRAETQPGSVPYFEVLGLLRKSALLEFGKDGPEEVNDDFGHAAVLRMFDVAIDLAEKGASQ